jgi:hypothetical protein
MAFVLPFSSSWQAARRIHNCSRTVFWHTCIDMSLGKDRETNNETTVARQQSAHQWNGWVEIAWEPQETRMQH